MAKLQVRHEGEGLTHRDVTESLKDHQCQRSPGLDVTENELSQHVQADLVIGDGLDNTYG